MYVYCFRSCFRKPFFTVSGTLHLAKAVISAPLEAAAGAHHRMKAGDLPEVQGRHVLQTLPPLRHRKPKRLETKVLSALSTSKCLI